MSSKRAETVRPESWIACSKWGNRTLWLSEWLSNARQRAASQAELLKSLAFLGAGDVTRTRDLLITNQLLYQLSYAGQVGEQTFYHGGPIAVRSYRSCVQTSRRTRSRRPADRSLFAF